MLHLVLVNVAMMQQTLQVLVMNLNLPLRLLRLPESLTEEWRPSEEVILVQGAIVGNSRKGKTCYFKQIRLLIIVPSQSCTGVTQVENVSPN